MQVANKATRINLLGFKSVQTRTIHRCPSRRLPVLAGFHQPSARPVNTFTLATVSGLLLAAGFANAATPASPTSLSAPSLTPQLELRLRTEAVDQSGPLQSAVANTLRYRLGLASPSTRGLSAYVESEGVAVISDDNYNSGPGGNGRSNRSLIADPAGNELNQAYVDYTPNDLFKARLGRQRLTYDNARFIGNVGWRQNEQTLDGLALTLSPATGGTLHYAYIQNVNRIFFSDAGVDGHLFNVSLSMLPALALTGYGYLLDFDTLEDSKTLGLRLTGEQTSGRINWAYTLEYAVQDAYADAPEIVDADYRHLQLSAARAGWTVTAGQEVLSGNGVRGFSTPLATLHKFNGWADAFLNTPADGLDDRYLGLGHGARRLKAKITYHSFRAQNSKLRYGDELDLLLAWKWTPKISLTLKLARYRADRVGVDTDKLTLQLDYRL